MPAQTERQRRQMCAAWDFKLGKTTRSSNPEAAKIADSMTLKQLEDFCKSPPKKKYPFIKGG